MMDIKIVYDFDKDKENYKYCLIDKAYPSYGRDEIKILPPSASKLQTDLELSLTPEEKSKIIDLYLSKNDKCLPFFEISAKSLSLAWEVISKKYLEKLLKYLQINDYEILPVTCYLTTLKLCPYDRNRRYFYVPFYANIADQMRIVVHELMHIIFLDNYQQHLEEQGVANQGILDISESLTVLLNLEFREFMLVEEINNKPSTFDLQNIVKDEYNKKTSFKSILQILIQNRLL